MKTELSDFLKRLRTASGETLTQMANRLDVSASFLSGVEHGRFPVPQRWIDIIPDVYELNEEVTIKFFAAVRHSMRDITIDFTDMPVEQKDLIIYIKDNIDKLDAVKIDAIKRIIQA